MRTLSPRSLPPEAAPVFLAEGAILLLLGMAAVVYPRTASAAGAEIFGWLLIAAAAVGLYRILRTRPHLHPWWALLGALAVLTAGVVLILNPFAGAAGLGVVIAVALGVRGAATVAAALDKRSAYRPWLLALGIAEVALGAGLAFLLPRDAPEVVGLIVGINFIIGALAVTALGLTLLRRRRSPTVVRVDG